jgi:hypothetical protein
MKRLTSGACAIAIVLALGAAGCGGDDSTTESSTAVDSTAALTSDKDAFVAKANQICTEGNKAIDTAGQQLYASGKPTEAETEKFATDVLIPAVQSQVTAIGQLPFPEGDEEQVTAILDAAQQGIDDAKADPASLLSAKADPFAEANKLASAYGMTACGGG